MIAAFGTTTAFPNPAALQLEQRRAHAWVARSLCSPLARCFGHGWRARRSFSRSNELASAPIVTTAQLHPRFRPTSDPASSGTHWRRRQKPHPCALGGKRHHAIQGAGVGQSRKPRRSATLRVNRCSCRHRQARRWRPTVFFWGRSSLLNLDLGPERTQSPDEAREADGDRVLRHQPRFRPRRQAPASTAAMATR